MYANQGAHTHSSWEGFALGRRSKSGEKDCVGKAPPEHIGLNAMGNTTGKAMSSKCHAEHSGSKALERGEPKSGQPVPG